MKGSLKANTGFLLLVLLCGYSRSGGVASPGTPNLRDTQIHTVARLIGKVRKSLGYDAFLKLSRGLTVEESGTDHNSSAGFVYSFGLKGKARRESTSSKPD